MIDLENNLKLKIMTKENITKCYINWMNDYEVTKFTEQRFEKHTKESIERFIVAKYESNTDELHGIFINNRHIGNILFSSIDYNNLSCNLSYLIGDKLLWGKGIGRYIVSEALKIIFNKLKLRKVSAGCYENNYGSIKILEKNNFLKEGIRKNQVNFEGKRIDVFIFGLLKGMKS